MKDLQASNSLGVVGRVEILSWITQFIATVVQNAAATYKG